MKIELVDIPGLYNINLLPCPFCGSYPFVYRNEQTGNYGIECINCNGKQEGTGHALVEVIAMWQARK